MPDPNALAEDGYRTFLRSQYDAVALLDGRDRTVSDNDYAWAFRIAMRAGLPQQSVADVIGVTQPTISRWAREDNLPKNNVVRQAYISELLTSFAEHIVAAGGADPRPLPAHPSRPSTESKRKFAGARATR